MDKLLSRAIRAKSQAARRSKKKYEMVVTRHLNNTRKENAAYLKMVGDDRRTVRAEEKEDHRLGPLAPRRAVGKEELEAYGSFDQSRIIPPSVPRQFRIKHWNICEKERVVVLRGPDRHKIGAVKSIDKKNNTVIVEGLNMMPMKIPQVFMNLGDGQQAVMNVEAPIHYKDVRLVVPMPDPVTGDLKDTIVANITTSGVFHNRQTGEYEWTRYIAGTDTEISWPEKVEKEAFDMPGDTRIMDVEVVSYAPTLLEPPFPPSVMDELRNKYSKFRTRHDPEFLAKIKQEEEAENTRLNSRLRTPMQEFNKLRREALKARGPPVMTESILEQIGRVMAQNRPELLEKVKIQSQID